MQVSGISDCPCKCQAPWSVVVCNTDNVVGLLHRETGHQGLYPGSSVYLCQHWLSRLISKCWAPKAVGCHLIYSFRFPTTSKFLCPFYELLYKFWVDSYRYACPHGYRLSYIVADLHMHAQILVLHAIFPVFWEGPSPSPLYSSLWCSDPLTRVKEHHLDLGVYISIASSCVAMFFSLTMASMRSDTELITRGARQGKSGSLPRSWAWHAWGFWIPQRLKTIPWIALWSFSTSKSVLGHKPLFWCLWLCQLWPGHCCLFGGSSWVN